LLQLVERVVVEVDQFAHLPACSCAGRDAGIQAIQSIKVPQDKFRGDSAIGERDKLNDKYLETKWQLSAALNNMPQGLVMFDSKTKTARELFPAQAAELIEQRDRQLLTQHQQLEEIVDTVDNPRRGRRTIAIRRLQVGGADHESHLLVSMIEDRTDQAKINDKIADKAADAAA
jgi:hypothetical protein